MITQEIVLHQVRNSIGIKERKTSKIETKENPRLIRKEKIVVIDSLCMEG